MNYRVLALIGVRLLAIWLIVTGIGALPQLGNFSLWFPDFHASGDALSNNLAVYHTVVFGMALTVLVPLILGFLMWVFARWLSDRMVSASEDVPPTIATPMLVQGAIAIAGLVIVVTALPNLIYTVINVIYQAAESHQYTVPSSYTAEISLDLWLTLAVRVILVLLGLGMFIGSRRLRDWIFKLRTMNT